MRMKIMALVALAAVILAAIVLVSPHSTIVANEVSGEVYAIDILGLTKQAKDLPVQQYAAHLFITRVRRGRPVRAGRFSFRAAQSRRHCRRR